MNQCSFIQKQGATVMIS